MHLLSITVRCWCHRGDSALEDLVLGMDERAVRDDSNQLSSEEFDECLAIVFCHMQPAPKNQLFGFSIGSGFGGLGKRSKAFFFCFKPTIQEWA